MFIICFKFLKIDYQIVSAIFKRLAHIYTYNIQIQEKKGVWRRDEEIDKQQNVNG